MVLKPKPSLGPWFIAFWWFSSQQYISDFGMRCKSSILLYSLGNLSAASLLARDGGACDVRPGLVDEKGEPPRTPSIYATDTWSGRMGEAKYKRRDASDDKRGCKVRNAKCEMRGAKWECYCNANANVDAWFIQDYRGPCSGPTPLP